MPLLNTCLIKSAITIPNRKLLYCVLIVVLLTIISPFATSTEDAVQQPQSGAQNGTLDVYILDLPCDVNSTCDISSPTHLVEYFGADWCEPCESIELSLTPLDYNDVALIQHHPSVQDQSYLNYSKQIFEEQYRLLFIPSIVINSNSLLTGAVQGQELNQSLIGTDYEFTGIDDISVENGMLFWNTSTNYNLTVWRLEQIKHEYDNRTLPYLAVDRLMLANDQRQHNISHLQTQSEGRLVFVLQDDSMPKTLQSISTSPTGEKSLSELEEDSSNIFTYDGGYDLAIIIFVMLFLALLPALFWFRKLEKEGFDEGE